MMAVASGTVLVTVTVTWTNPPAGREPVTGATLTLPGKVATRMAYSETGPFTAVSRKDPLTGWPLLDVSSRWFGVAARNPCAGEVDGVGVGVGERDGDGDGAGVPGPVAGPGLDTVPDTVPDTGAGGVAG